MTDDKKEHLSDFFLNLAREAATREAAKFDNGEWSTWAWQAKALLSLLEEHLVLEELRAARKAFDADKTADTEKRLQDLRDRVELGK